MQMILMRIVLITIVILFSYIIYKKKEKYKLIIDNKTWLIISWMLCLGLYFFVGIKYSYNLSFYSFGFILLFLGLFIIGQYISKKLDKQDCQAQGNYTKRLNLFPLFIVSLVSVIIYSIYIIVINDIEIGTTRDINTNGIATFFQIFSSAALVIWLYELAYALLNDKKIPIYGYISILIYNLPGVLISGRDALIIFVISTFIVFWYCIRLVKNEMNIDCKIIKLVKKYGIYAIAVVLIYLIFLSSNRYGTDKEAVINMFRWSSNCEFPKYLKFIYYNLGGIGKLVLNAVFYYSSQMSKFAIIFDNYDGPYLFGLYQLHYISRLLPEAWNLDFSIVFNRVTEITNDVGIPGMKVFWDTAIGYFIYDFGRIGSLVASFISGVIVGKIEIWCNRNKNILKVLVQVFICVAMFLTVEMSPIFDYHYIFPLFWLVMILIYDNRKNKIIEKERKLV